jgi:selenocysteine lyase/cysteine desulfurase
MKENYYFDNAATTLPKPEPVYEFMDQFFRSHGVNPGRSGHQLAVEAETMIVQTRRLLAEFFGFAGDPARVTFSLSATDSMNIALLGLMQPGDHMIITRMEHNAVLRPANHFERDRQISVTRVAADQAGYVDPQEIRRSIRPNTRVVVVNHASNVTGSLQDIEAIGRVVRETNAILVLDSCQTAGVVAIPMDDWGIDVLVYTGHKGLFGPMGIGGMIVAAGVDIRPLRTGGTGVDSLSPFHPDGYPHRLEAGTLSLPGVAGLNAAQKWFADLRPGPRGRPCCQPRPGLPVAQEHIHAVETGFTRRLIEAFEGAVGRGRLRPRNNQPRVATLSMNIGDIPAEQVGTISTPITVCAYGPAALRPAGA